MRNHTSRSHHSWRHGWSNRPRRSKSERLPSMIHHRPEPSDKSQTGGRHARGWRRRVWSCQPCLGWLERRTLLAADLIPTVPAFQPVPTDFSGNHSPIAVGNFYGASFPVDLVAPDGIYVGNGDGTFQSTPVAGPLAQSGWTVSAIAVGDWNQDNLPDIAFTEISPDGSTAQLCVLRNEGGGKFQLGTPLPVASEPVAIQTIDFGNGIVDLAVADSVTGKNIAIFVGN